MESSLKQAYYRFVANPIGAGLLVTGLLVVEVYLLYIYAEEMNTFSKPNWVSDFGWQALLLVSILLNGCFWGSILSYISNKIIASAVNNI